MLYLSRGAHTYNGKCHSISYVSPSLFSNTAKTICSVNSVCTLCSLVNYRKKEKPERYFSPSHIRVFSITDKEKPLAVRQFEFWVGVLRPVGI